MVFGGGLVAQAQQGSPTAQAAMKSLTVATADRAEGRGQRASDSGGGFRGLSIYRAVLRLLCAVQHSGAADVLGVLAAVLSLYMLYVLATGTPLPALVPIAAVIISMNLRRFRYERAEAFALFYAGLIILAVFGFLAWRR